MKLSVAKIVGRYPNAQQPIELYDDEITKRDALKDEIDSFVLTVQGESVPHVSGRDGLRALRLATEVCGAI